MGTFNSPEDLVGVVKTSKNASSWWIEQPEGSDP